jgi:hypothetical protein
MNTPFSRSNPSPERPGKGRWESLEDLLKHTLRAENVEVALSAEDRRALAEVVRRHRGEPLALEPVAVELVQAMLSSFFASWGKDRALWRPMAQDIASSLYDDPPSQERLQRIWLHLCETHG